jgi:hypothetical protein
MRAGDERLRYADTGRGEVGAAYDLLQQTKIGVP